jgi:ribosomal-protein-alanine N-acetyltransferase
MIIGIDCSSKEGGLATSESLFYPLAWVEDIPLKLKELNIRCEDIEKILITYGPGSFTSLRVGLVTAQGLTLPRNIPILAYSTFLAMIEGSPDGNLIPLIPARNEVVYAAHYIKTGKKIKEVFKDRILNMEELVNYIEANIDDSKPVIFGEGAKKNSSFLKERGYSVSTESFSPLACKLFRLYESKTKAVRNPVVPLYIASSAAIRKRAESEIKIKEMKEKDLEAILEIEKDVFSDPWPFEMFYTHLLSDTCIKVVAELSGKTAGYLIGCEEGRKFHLRNIAVSREYWRRGFGTKLLTYLLERIEKNPGIKSCYLEHRIGNEAAFELYKSLGFTFKGIDKNYYSKGEDAVIMEIKF